MLKISWREAASWRITRHHLSQRAPAKEMLAVASRLCGLHAQVMSCAELMLWARVDGLRRGAVSEALWQDRTLVKTWAMRGTLHLLASRELPLWQSVLGTSPRYLKAAQWQKYFGITLDQLARFTDAVRVALDGRVMTREELMKEAGRIAGSEALAANLEASSWGTILKPAAFSGHLCFAPSVGQRVRFTHPETWLGKRLSKVDPQAATTEVARRFLAAYGPATYHDLARWWGGARATAREWIAALKDEAVAVEVNGQQAWMLAADAKRIREVVPLRSVRLLPGFDQYVVAASRHAEELLPGDFRALVYRPQGWISPVLLVNGFMQGTWRHEMKLGRVQVVVEPFVKTPAWVRRDAEAEAERLAHFFGRGLEFRWGRV